jgi:uncharacterized OsmC-like protein
LAACIGFYAERFLRNHDLNAHGLKVEARFDMSTDRPSRVGRVDIQVQLPAGFPAARREVLQTVLQHCTVHNSLVNPPTVRIALEERSTKAA